MNIPLFRIHHDNRDIEAISRVIDRGTSWANGPEVEQFENELSDYFDVKHCLVLNSGTSALHLALLSLGIGPGDEVIVPSFTFIATVNAVLFVGATPVFADIEPETMGLNPPSYGNGIIDVMTMKTKAIIPIHYGGLPCKEIENIRKFVEYSNTIKNCRHIHIIEDACESFGTEINGKKVGTFGDIGILSFCQNKLITTGEGGAVITDSKELYEKMKLLRSHGREDSGDYFHGGVSEYKALGYNFRMSSMQAALGLSQMEKLPLIINRRWTLSKYLDDRLSEIDEIKILNYGGLDTIRLFYTIQLKDRDTRDRLSGYLNGHGISTKVYFEPVHRTPFYAGMGYYDVDLPETMKASETVLSLPFYVDMTIDRMDYIIHKLEKFFLGE